MHFLGNYCFHSTIKYCFLDTSILHSWLIEKELYIVLYTRKDILLRDSFNFSNTMGFSGRKEEYQLSR